jgi:ATP-dependent Lon protease
MKIFDAAAKKDPKAKVYPLVHVKDVVVFPHTFVPFVAVTRSSSQAIDEAMKTDSRVFIALLKSEDAETGSVEVHENGTLCRVVQRLPLPDGSLRILFSGETRGRIEALSFDKPYIECSVTFTPESVPEGDRTVATFRALKKSFLLYAEASKKLNPELVKNVEQEEEPLKLVHLVSHALIAKAEKKQEILDVDDVLKRAMQLMAFLESETELSALQRRISQKVRNKIDKNQKEYFLQEQLKEINHELGRDNEENELSALEKRFLEKKPSEDAQEKMRKEIARLAKLQPLSPEAGVLRTYCEWLADLPWSLSNPESRDITEAERVLERDHYGLEKAKERILDFIAVRQLNEKGKGPILCFSGPPGTGKTSLARSVASALGREYVRVSLGGVRDEAEIRGHRKTYVGALPGKILQGMKRAKSANPVFLLDEIDKLDSDFHGDPASALLEVLDPEQNRAFMDHYLEIPYDLSSVMFITTANSLHSIPYPLLDRMEVIEIPGYSEFEKLEIAKNFLIPKEKRENGLEAAAVDISKQAILDIVNYYTMESGVRNLEREIAKVMRKIAREAVRQGMGGEGKTLSEFSYSVTPAQLPKLLGKRKREEDFCQEPIVGSATGLAWTELGGAVLTVECAAIDGNGEFILTGKLGDVMKESARTALSYVRSHISEFPLCQHDFSERSIHIHVPEGAIPKDGPSAGITLVASILSLVCGTPLNPSFAMTGEVTLSGRVLPIGGVKEKVLAAHRYRIKNLLLPAANEKDLDDVPPEVRKEINFHFVKTIDEALRLLFPAGMFTSPKARYSKPQARVSAKTKTRTKTTVKTKTRTKAP